MGDGFLFGKPERLVQSANKERLNRLALSVFLDAERDRMALRFLQNHLRNPKERVGPAGHLDLACQGFDPLIIGEQGDIDFW